MLAGDRSLTNVVAHEVGGRQCLCFSGLSEGGSAGVLQGVAMRNLLVRGCMGNVHSCLKQELTNVVAHEVGYHTLGFSQRPQDVFGGWEFVQVRLLAGAAAASCCSPLIQSSGSASDSWFWLCTTTSLAYASKPCYTACDDPGLPPAHCRCRRLRTAGAATWSPTPAGSTSGSTRAGRSSWSARLWAGCR